VEGDSGTKEVSFVVTLDRANSSQPVRVTYTTADGTAKAGSDYKSASGKLTFAAGETSKTISIAVYGDKSNEPDEYFSVLLSGASSDALIDDGTGLGWILNDDGSKGGSKRTR
jgi:hypothetical protein